MSTLAPPKVKKFSDDSMESKVYAIVESFSEFILLANHRNRLSYCLLKYLNGEGDEPKITLKSSKIEIKGITVADLAKKLDDELETVKS
jgi:hypothetical protein